MSLVIEVKVIPNASRNRWDLDAGGKLKCYLKSPPVDGKANIELINLLSKIVGIPKRDIEILSGLTDRHKRVCLSIDLTFNQLLGILGIERQLTFADTNS